MELTDQGIFNILLGLCKLDLEWSDLSKSTQEGLFTTISSICFTMSPQSICNTLYALGKLGVYEPTLSEKAKISLEMAIRKAVPQMQGRDVLQIFQVSN